MQCIDFRNARYQGQIQKLQPHGVGITIDDNHLFCLSKWKRGHIDGPVFIAYPDNKILCGNVKQNSISGLCCFYLPGHIKTYINYRKDSKDNNFITVLPEYKLILEISSEEQKPKIISHQKYQENGQNQISQISRIFGKNQQLSQFSSWQHFLTINFTRPYRDLIYMSQNGNVNFTDYYIGINQNGLGIKIVQYYTMQQLKGQDQSSIAIHSVGNFYNNSQLIGYGKKQVDSLMRRVEEGQYSWKDKRTIQYIKSNRPKEAVQLYQKHLLQSMHFQNKFLPLSFLYYLQKVYAQINIQMVEQTHKIAQVVLHDGKERQVVVAEIQKKGEKKKTSVGKKKDEQMVVLPEKLSSYVAKGKKQDQRDVPSQDSIQSIPRTSHPQLRNAKQAIYSSASKMRKSNKKQRQVVVKSYKKIFVDEDIKKNDEQNKYLNKYRYVNESTPPKNGIIQGRDKFNFQSIQSKKDNSFYNASNYPRRNTFINSEDLYSSLLETVYGRSGRKSPIHNNNRNFKEKQKSSEKFKFVYDPHRLERSYYLNEKSPVKEDYLKDRHSQKQQANSRSFDRLINDDSLSEQYNELKQIEQQIGYFNSLIHKQQKFALSKSSTTNGNSSNVTKTNKTREKTPGKIRTIKRKKLSQFEQD